VNAREPFEAKPRWQWRAMRRGAFFFGVCAALVFAYVVT
jgi:hypothetical protein